MHSQAPMYSGALDTYKNSEINWPGSNQLFNQDTYDCWDKKDTERPGPCFLIYTYTHFGSGEPQSAQCLFPDWDKRTSSLLIGPI